MRAVLFDMDGVLVFSEDVWFRVYNATLSHFGHASISREGFDAIYGNGTEADRAMYMQERSVGEIDAAYARFFVDHLDEMRVNPEAAGALGALHAAGIRTALATNTNRPLADRILSLAGLAPLLDAVASANEAGAGKPDPAVVRLASARVHVPLAECLFVGDSKYDAEAARRAPVAFRGYRFGTGPRIESLEELLAIRIDSEER
jgi:HAD superfamily hydrolase (TIGR01509 family)